MSTYVIFALAFAASAASPGPEIASLTGRMLADGARASLPMVSGIIIGKLLMLTAALLGLSAVAVAMGSAFVALKFLGVAYLLWIAVKRWRLPRNGQPVFGEAAGQSDGLVWSELYLGLLMTLSNPVAILFYLALLPAAIDLGRVDVKNYLILCSIIVVVMACVVLVYGALADLARHWLNDASSKKWMDKISSILLLAAACWMMLR